MGTNEGTFYRHSLKLGDHPKLSRVTVCGVLSNGKLKIGVSLCSKNDNFARKKGREISLVRAVKVPLEVNFEKVQGKENPGRAFKAIADSIIDKTLEVKNGQYNKALVNEYEEVT